MAARGKWDATEDLKLARSFHRFRDGLHENAFACRAMAYRVETHVHLLEGLARVQLTPQDAKAMFQYRQTLERVRTMCEKHMLRASEYGDQEELREIGIRLQGLETRIFKMVNPAWASSRDNLLRNMLAPPRMLVGRDSLLEDCLKFASRRVDKDTGVLRVVNLYGPGGAGKASVAATLFTRLNEAFHGHNVYINMLGDTHDPLEPTAAMLRAVLRIQAHSMFTAYDCAVDLVEQRRLKRFWRQKFREQPCLLWLDHCHDIDQVLPLLPEPESDTVVVVCSKSKLDLASHRRLVPLAKALAIGQLTKGYAVELLQTTAPRLSEEETRVLCKLMKNHCMSLKMCGMLLRKNAKLDVSAFTLNMRDFLRDHSAGGHKFETRRFSLPQTAVSNPSAEAETGLTEQGIETVLEFLFGHLTPQQQIILRVASVFPGFFLDEGIASVAGVSDIEKTHAVLTQLVRLKWVNFDSVEMRFFLHRSVRVVCRHIALGTPPDKAVETQMDGEDFSSCENEFDVWLTRFVWGYVHKLEELGVAYTAEMLPMDKKERVAQIFTKNHLNIMAALELCNAGTRHASTRTAMFVLDKAWDIMGALWHPKTLLRVIEWGMRVATETDKPKELRRLVSRKGKVLQVLLQYSEARAALHSALDQAIRVYGEHNHHVAEEKLNLASVWAAENKHHQAEEMFLDAIETMKTACAKRHPSRVAAAMEQLAAFHINNGDLERAEPVLLDAIKQRKAASPSEKHSAEMALSVEKLGDLYARKKQFLQAHDSYERSLRLHLGVHTGQHPHTAILYLKVGDMSAQSAEYGDAKESLQLALSCAERNPSNTKKEVINILEVYGGLYSKMGERDSAEHLYQRANSMWEELYPVLRADSLYVGKRSKLLGKHGKRKWIELRSDGKHGFLRVYAVEDNPMFADVEKDYALNTAELMTIDSRYPAFALGVVVADKKHTVHIEAPDGEKQLEEWITDIEAFTM